MTREKNRMRLPILLLGTLLATSAQASAQELTVTGRVTYNPFLGECLQEVPCLDAVELTRDEDWIPPPAAVNIVVRGTDRMTRTDRDGRYEISVPSPDASLMVLYIGHNRVEVPVEGRRVIDVRLTPTPLPVIERLLGLIMPRVIAGEFPDIDLLAEAGAVNRETARDMLWLVLGNREMAAHYPGEPIPDYRFEETTDRQGAHHD